MRVCDRILVVEDEKRMVNLIRTILLSKNYHVVIVSSGKEAMTTLDSYPPDLVLLSLELPDMNGLDLIKTVRSWSSLPIIAMSVSNHVNDEVTALNLGADDYMTKPFSSEQLLARVRVALRHARQGTTDSFIESGKYTTGELTVDYEKHEVLRSGVNCNLTQNEYRIVALLSKYPGRILTYDYILKELWGPQRREGNQILRVNMANIRRKIENDPADPQYILTKVGVGYWIADDGA